MKNEITLFLILLFINLSPSLNAQKVDEGKLVDVAFPVLDSLIGTYDRMGDYEKELLYTKAAVEKAKQEFGLMDSVYAVHLTALGSNYSEMGKYQAAEPLYLESKTILEKIIGKDAQRYTSVIGFLAKLYQATGRYEEAEPLYLEVKEAEKKVAGPMSPDYAGTLNDLAAFYSAMGKYEEAEPLYLESQEIVKTILGPEHQYYAISLSNLAALYNEIDRGEEALELTIKSLAIFKKVLGENSPGYAITLNNLASLYSDLGKFEEAEAVYGKSIDLYKKLLGEIHPNTAKSINNLAFLYEQMGQYEKAVSTSMESLEMYKLMFGEGDVEYAHVLNDLAAVYFRMGKVDLAYSYCLAGMANNCANFRELFPSLFVVKEGDQGQLLPSQVSRELNTQEVSRISELSFTSHSLMMYSVKILLKIHQEKYYKEKGTDNQEGVKVKLLQEYNIVKAVMEIGDQLRNEFSGRKNKLKILKENNWFLEFGLAVAFDLNEQKYYKEAFSFSEQNKSILLAESVKGNRARSLGDLPDSLAFKEIELQQTKEDIQKAKHRAQNQEELAVLTSKENDLNNEIDKFLKSLKDKYPKYHNLKYENITANAEDVQKLLNEKTLFLEYFVSDSMVHLFAVSKGDIELLRTPINTLELKKKIEAMRLALTNYNYITKKVDKAYSLYTETAYWFYQQLLEEALKGKNVEHLVIVTDGELGHLPFEAFLMERGHQGKNNYADLHYLVNDYNVSYNYSATLWKEILEAKPRNNNHQMLAYAASYPPLSKDIEGEGSAFLESRAPHIIKLRKVLSPLAAVVNEVKTLGDIFQGNFIYYENSGTSKKEMLGESFFKKNASDYGVIHLAMHGLIHPRVPMLSSLAFTENGDSLEDNFLQAYEISRLQLNADLVVLSACETGYGEFQQGEGVISLARSFMYAGIPSLIVSLWQVNDVSTAAIMKFFYKNLADGMAKDVALRQAKLHYIKVAKDLATHPAFWSPFIQLGDSRAIVVKTKGSWFPWVVGSSIALVIILLWIYLRRKETI